MQIETGQPYAHEEEKQGNIYKPVNSEFGNLMHEIVSASSECFSTSNRQQETKSNRQQKTEHAVILFILAKSCKVHK
jgi:hypothetical protein